MVQPLVLYEKRKNRELWYFKIKTFRPFPAEEVVKYLKKAKYVAIVEKDISLGSEGVLASEIKAACYNKTKAKLQSFIVGLGGKDITVKLINNINKEVQLKSAETKWMYL